ncbi:MAG: DUF58 domain-containing protein [Bacteroidota bacterium]
MPREVIPDSKERIGPPEVYVTLRDLVGLQHDAHGFSFLPSHAIQSLLSGRHRSRLRGRGLDFDEVRKYVAGDDIRNIDWRVTARVGETHSKVFTEERERPVLLIVDQTSSMFFGSRVYLKSVVAAHAAALGAWRTLEVGDRVGGIVFDDTSLDYVTPKRDRRSVQRILHLVAERNQALGPKAAEAGGNQLLEALRQAHQLVTHDYLVVVISDFMGFDDKVMKILIQLSRHNDLIAAQVSDPMEEKLPGANLVLTDGVFRTSLDRRKRAHEGVNRRQAELYQHLAAQMKRFGIPLLTFNTTEPVSTQLRKMVGGATRLKVKSSK